MIRAPPLLKNGKRPARGRVECQEWFEGASGTPLPSVYFDHLGPVLRLLRLLRQVRRAQGRRARHDGLAHQCLEARTGTGGLNR